MQMSSFGKGVPPLVLLFLLWVLSNVNLVVLGEKEPFLHLLGFYYF